MGSKPKAPQTMYSLWLGFEDDFRKIEVQQAEWYLATPQASESKMGGNTPKRLF